MDPTQLSDDDLDLANKLSSWTNNAMTDDQFNNAKLVRDAAQSKGLNPDFVLPMVMQESGFNHSAVSPAGAQGIMQVTPDTAKTYNCDDTTDINKNIDCGLNVLSDLSKKYNGDPNMTLTGYNAGPNTKFFQSGDVSDLPDETLNHIDKVSKIYGGDLPSVMKSTPPQKAFDGSIIDNSQVSDASELHPGQTVNSLDPLNNNPTNHSTTDVKRELAGTIGAATGASLDAGLASLPLIPYAFKKLMQQPSQDTTIVPRSGIQSYINKLTPANVNISVGDLENEYNKWLQLADPNAAPVKIQSIKGAADAIKALQPTPDIQVAKPVYKPVSGRPTVLEDTGRVISSTVPGTPAIDLSKYSTAASTNPMVNAVRNGAKNVSNFASNVAPAAAKILGGLAGGYTAGTNGYDAYNSYHRDNGWSVPAVTQGLASAGGLAATFGGLPGALVGSALQLPEQFRKAGIPNSPQIIKTNPNNPKRDLTDLFLSGLAD